jgi:hypothetical protein
MPVSLPPAPPRAVLTLHAPAHLARRAADHDDVHEAPSPRGIAVSQGVGNSVIIKVTTSGGRVIFAGQMDADCCTEWWANLAASFLDHFDPVEARKSGT